MENDKFLKKITWDTFRSALVRQLYYTPKVATDVIGYAYVGYDDVLPKSKFDANVNFSFFTWNYTKAGKELVENGKMRMKARGMVTYIQEQQS